MSLGHQMNMRNHQDRFGRLGELQTRTQKKALRGAINKLENELTKEQKASRDAAIKKVEDKA